MTTAPVSILLRAGEALSQNHPANLFLDPDSLKLGSKNMCLLSAKFLGNLIHSNS